MSVCPEVIKRLIERFDHQLDQVRTPDYNETQLRIDFVNPMFRQLGWDIDNTQGFAEQYREVVHEDRLRIAGANKAPDYSFRVGGVRKFFLEAKRPFVNVKSDPVPAYQLRRYGWSAKLPVSLLTDFEEFAVYDCRVQPKWEDKSSIARREFIAYHDYCDRWDFIENTFSKQAVLGGDFDRYCGTTRGRGAEEFDEAFLEEIEEWRRMLASNLALRNDDLTEQSLNFAVQRIIDRIIFLRICEDRGTEGPRRLQALLGGDHVYARLRDFFHDADARYNSGLFHFKREKDRAEAPDEITTSLEVDDATLKSIIKRLYYPESPYEFTVVSADILGSVYERFLGKVITLTPAHRAKIEEKPEVRKAGGVYYTPTYIVDYIVQQTGGKLLQGCKSPRDAAKVKILDPACGSGSFLIGAYQYLLDWHLKWYVADGPEKWSTGRSASLRHADRPSIAAEALSPSPSGRAKGEGPSERKAASAPSAHWALTTRERKRILLDNIHGVDIDYQAVEVTKLSLLLKVLEGETAETLGRFGAISHERALPDLGRNILCGNSLIGTDITTSDPWAQLSKEERQRVNPFDYQRAFPHAFRQGGFDAVIGNPPYGAYATPEEAQYLRTKFATLANSLDTFIMFVEASAGLLRSAGRLGFIIPSGWVSTPSSKPLRAFFLDKFVPESFVSLPFDVFVGAYIDAVIVTAKRNEKSGRPGDHAVNLVVFPHRYKIQNVDEFPRFTKMGNVGPWGRSEELEFLITSSDAELRLLGKIRTNTGSVDDFALVKRGIETYDLHETTRGMKRPVYAFDGVLQRYLLRHGPRQFLDYTEEIRESKPWEFFSSPRILLRQVLSRKLRLQSTFTADPFLTNQSVQSLVGREGIDAAALKTLLACLNGRLLSWYFVNINSAARRDDFPKIVIKQTRDLPLPFRNRADLHAVTTRGNVLSAVDKILALHHEERSVEHPQEAERLRREIDAIDRRIDQLVYELYGLTDDEIRLVEAATATPSAQTEVDQ